MVIGSIMLLTFLALILLGIPVSICMGLSTLTACLAGGYDIQTLPLMVLRGVDSFTLMAIPFFIIAGNLLNVGGITQRIFDFSNTMVGHITGGLAQVNVLASMIFSGISGTAVGDAAGLGVIEMDAMTKRGYDKKFSAAITLASSVIGPIIPPSVPFVIYAVIAEVSIAKLFLAGVVPGFVIGAALMTANYVMAKAGLVKVPEPQPFEIKKAWGSFKDGILALLAPIIILGGMTAGVVTPTEAGLLAVMYALLVGLIYRELTWQNIFAALRTGLYSSVGIMVLIGFGYAMGWVVSIERLPVIMADSFLSFTDNKYTLLFMINVLLLLLGMVIEGIPIKLILLPILLPIIDSFGIDRIHFGVLMTCNTLIGLATPPVGLGLFVMSSITDLEISDIVKAILPFYIPLLAALALITYFPTFTLWLPGVLMPAVN